MNKVFAAAALCAVLAVPLAAAAQEGHVVHAATATLAPFPNMPDCFKGAAVHGDPGTGPSTLLVRATGACGVPRHWHTPTENLLMVSGTARVGMKGQPAETLRAGSYAYIPAKHQHEFSCPGACSFFVVSDGPFDIHYVDDAGNEIPAEQVLKAKPAVAPKKP
jgi:mannose-6-phosphate isomerase-like protein (cupin superfamily)